MSRLTDAFKGKKAFIAFITGGDPSLGKTVEYAAAMAEAGADIIEIGIPFSDPIADGEVIQRSSLRALKAGAGVESIFECVGKIREKTDVPLVFLTYLNPVFKYGYERFFNACKTFGVDGIIIPDMPYEEQAQLKPIARDKGVDVISLIAPTSEDRIREIAKNANGFIYVVSSMGVTGGAVEVNAALNSAIGLIRAATDTPAAVGFGVSTPEQAAQISRLSDGVIVGSAIVRLIEESGDGAQDALAGYVRAMKRAISQ
ncbi:MAG: tryptophan synthase subunit alpha [Clostridiales bacterium]|jgi:tryptophan synthase alpha chain|nr:tryptophan synthase subunit alpha [Clostridiales bacterium]